MDFSIIRRAGLKGKDFANLVGVSPAAVSYWALGERTPREEHRVTVENALALLDNLVGKGKLPRTDKKSPDSREALVEKLKAYLLSHRTN